MMLQSVPSVASSRPLRGVQDVAVNGIVAGITSSVHFVVGEVIVFFVLYEQHLC